MTTAASISSICVATIGRDAPVFRGVLQEYSPAEQGPAGPVQLIFQGTTLGFAEGSHPFKRNGYYYLLAAEGGDGWGHAVTMARSRELTGGHTSCMRTGT